MAIVCEAYPQVQVSKENFVNIQRAIDRLGDGLPEEGFTPKLIDTYTGKRATSVVFQEEETRNWLGNNVSSLKAWDLFGLEGLPTYKWVVGWFPGPVEDMEPYF